MSNDLLNQLRILESEYAGQPLVAQRADLREINRLRSKRSAPEVRDSKPLGAVETEAKPKSEAESGPGPHRRRRAIYEAYRRTPSFRFTALRRPRGQGDRRPRRNAGALATMGTGGNPLLYRDHCGKPIILEGGKFQGVYADAAWRRNPSNGWKSWISGGMVVEIAAPTARFASTTATPGGTTSSAATPPAARSRRPKTSSNRRKARGRSTGCWRRSSPTSSRS